MNQSNDTDNGRVQEDLLRHVGAWYDVDNADSMAESPWDLLQAEVFQMPYRHAITQEHLAGQYPAEASSSLVFVGKKTKRKSKKDAAGKR